VHWIALVVSSQHTLWGLLVFFFLWFCVRGLIPTHTFVEAGVVVSIVMHVCACVMHLFMLAAPGATFPPACCLPPQYVMIVYIF
jgi:hypothetical protein